MGMTRMTSRFSWGCEWLEPGCEAGWSKLSKCFGHLLSMLPFDNTFCIAVRNAPYDLGNIHIWGWSKYIYIHNHIYIFHETETSHGFHPMISNRDDSYLRSLSHSEWHHMARPRWRWPRWISYWWGCSIAVLNSFTVIVIWYIYIDDILWYTTM
jgi:hypothetical protein